VGLKDAIASSLCSFSPSIVIGRINSGLLAVDVNMSIPGTTFHCTLWNVRPALRCVHALSERHTASRKKKNLEVQGTSL
jgi:hypothetical protein